MAKNADRNDPAAARENAALVRAIDAFNAGALDDATNITRELLKTAPANADGWNLLAMIAERRGQIADAVTILKHAVSILPRATGLHVSLGVQLARMGHLADAENTWRYALAIDPYNEGATISLAGMLTQLGRFDDAEAVFRPGLAFAPDHPAFNFHFARLQLTRGRADDARAAFEKVATLTKPRGKTRKDERASGYTPRYADVLAHLGALLFSQGKLLEAVDYLRDAVELDAGSSAQTQFAYCVVNAPFTTARLDLEPLLVRAFQESWIMPSDLVRGAARVLRLNPAFVAAADAAKRGGANLLQETSVHAVSENALLRAILDVAILADADLESLLGAIRAALLKASEKPDNYLAFVVSLANQCFAGEYVFAETAEERDDISKLQKRIDVVLADDAPITATDLAILAAYRPLYRLANAEKVAVRKWPQALDPLIRQQVKEPLDEKERARTLPALTPISDEISKAVQSQYEENPYPRWLRAPFRALGLSLEEWLRTYLPHLQIAPKQRTKPLEVLVAGCGTGQESIAAACRFASANVLAIDLSRASLAYAARKTAELGLSNVTYAQADILELGNIGRQFDLVESGGVLHHLADPLRGWKILSDLVVPGGYMVLALYSESGRRDLSAAAAFIRDGKYGSSADDIRRFRQDVLALPESDPVRAHIQKRDDFFNLSMLRDLLFHVQEQNFTIPKIGTVVKQLGLEFCGFAVDPATRQRFQIRFGKPADFSSLAAWEIVEAENPEVFSGMYHFILRKPVQPA